MNSGYRFWIARGIYFNEAAGSFEVVEMEFELFKPINDDNERIELEVFLNSCPLIWKDKKIKSGTIQVWAKYYSKIKYTVK